VQAGRGKAQNIKMAHIVKFVDFTRPPVSTIICPEAAAWHTSVSDFDRSYNQNKSERSERALNIYSLFGL
jgi:hypothetical protein